MGLTSLLCKDNSISSLSQELEKISNLSIEAKTSFDHNSPLAHDVTLQLPHPSSENLHLEAQVWHQHTMKLNDSDSQISTTTSGLSNLTDQISQGNTDILNSHQHYEANNFQGIVIGNPDEAIKHFHQQNQTDTCGIAVQQSIIEQTTGVHLSENQLIQTAQNYDLYNQGSGTPINHLGDLVSLETNVPMEKHFGGSLSEIADKIANGEQVMVSVNAEIANVPDSQSIFGSLSSQMLDHSIQNHHVANHVEQVIGIGIKNNDPLHPVVIVNDPSSPNGKALEIPAEQFNASWETGGKFMASTVTHPESLLSSLGTNHVDNQHLTDYNVGCKVTAYESDHSIYIDGSKVGNYTGNSFYWNSGNVAGTWSCDSNHAYTKDGKDLGYAPTWKDAALLIYKQD